MEGLQRPTLGRCGNFTTVTGHQHWVCASTVGSDDGMVDLYDSMFHSVIENKVEEQVKFARNKMFTADTIIFAISFSVIISAYLRNPSFSSFGI